MTHVKSLGACLKRQLPVSALVFSHFDFCTCRSVCRLAVPMLRPGSSESDTAVAGMPKLGQDPIGFAAAAGAGMKHRVPLTARNAPTKMAATAAAYAQIQPRRALSARPSSSNGRRPSGSTDPLAAHGYQTISPIAQGAFSQVTRAKHHSTSCEVAVKMFHKAKITKEAHLAQAMKNELDVLKLLQPAAHPNIANVLEVVETPRSVLAILEYCGGGSLQRCLQGKPHATGLGEESSRIVAVQVARALSHMHGMGIAHRDVKPENVLFVTSSQTQIKMCDFGFAINCGGKRLRTVCGSPQYMAPELSKREPYHGWACDVWAFGALVFEMLEGRPAFRGASMEQLGIRIMRASHEAFSGATPPTARALIKGMLQIDPMSRTPANQAIEHPWFQTAKAA